MFTVNTNVFEIVDMFSVRHCILLIFKCIFVNFHILNTKIKCKINVVLLILTIGTEIKRKLINKIGIVLL